MALSTFKVNNDALDPFPHPMPPISLSATSQRKVSDCVRPTWVIPLPYGQLISSLSYSAQSLCHIMCHDYGMTAHHIRGKGLQWSHLRIPPTTDYGTGITGPWVHTSAPNSFLPGGEEGDSPLPESRDTAPPEALPQSLCPSTLGQQALFSSEPLPPLQVFLSLSRMLSSMNCLDYS